MYHPMLSDIGLSNTRNRHGHLIDFRLTRAVAGELIWDVVAEIGLTDANAVCLFESVKNILQGKSNSGTLRAAVWHKLNEIKNNSSTSEDDAQQQLIKDLAEMSMFFYLEKDYSEIEQAKKIFTQLIQGLPTTNRGNIVAAIGYKFGLTSL